METLKGSNPSPSVVCNVPVWIIPPGPTFLARVKSQLLLFLFLFLLFYLLVFYFHFPWATRDAEAGHNRNNKMK